MSNKLRVVRAEKWITQIRLGLQAGVNAPKISLIENELVQPTELEKRKLALALEALQDELFPAEGRRG